MSTAQSFAVDTKLRKDVQLTGARGWGVQSTPTLIVAGKYRVNASQALPQGQMFNVVDYLVAKEAALLSQADEASEAEESE
jgi:thiol:disulfide interchange protein DsbA